MEIAGNVSLDTAYDDICKGSLWVTRIVQYTVYNSMCPPLQSQSLCIVCSTHAHVVQLTRKQAQENAQRNIQSLGFNFVIRAIIFLGSVLYAQVRCTKLASHLQ